MKGRRTPETLRIAALNHKKRGTSHGIKMANELERQARLLEQKKAVKAKLP